MADQYTPEEIQAIFDVYNENIRLGIPISQNLAKQMADATKGVKDYTYMLNSSFKQLGIGLKVLGQDIAKGADGASVFNNSLEASAQVMSTFLSKFGLLGSMFGGLAQGVAKYAGAVNKQSDALYKSYQELSKSGTIGAGGMSEVFDSMQRFGYAVDELGDMQAMLAKNSQTLAQFGGTAVSGARAMAEVAGVLQHGQMAEHFRRLVPNVDEINQNIAGFIKTQIAIGRGRASIEKDLATETGKYIEQIVAVQKLTGQTREQLEEKEQQALKEQAFAYTQYELQKRAAAGDEQAQKEYNRNRMLNQVLEGKAREQFVAAIGGDVGAMQDLLLTVPEFATKIQAGATDVGDLMNDYVGGLKRSVDAFGGAAKFNFYNDFQLPMHENLKMISQYGTESFNTLMEEAKRNSEATDDATKGQTQLRLTQMNTRQSLENLLNVGIGPVTKGMQILADAIDRLVSFIPFSGRSKEKWEKEQAEKTAGAPSFTGNKKEFYNQMYNTLLAQATKAGVANPEAIARLGAAQSALETGYGKSTAAGNNYFGIKARAGDANASMVDTKEWDPTLGRYVTQKAGFRRYGSMEESAADYIRFLQENQRYQGVLAAQNAAAAIEAQGRTGYATDPAYAAKLRGIHSSATGASGAFGFQGTISGPMSGYRPNLLMHGTENLSIQPASSLASSSTATGGSGNISDLLARVDELIYVSKNQLSVNEKILKMQH